MLTTLACLSLSSLEGFGLTPMRDGDSWDAWLTPSEHNIGMLTPFLPCNLVAQLALLHRFGLNYFLSCCLSPCENGVGEFKTVTGNLGVFLPVRPIKPELVSGYFLCLIDLFPSSLFGCPVSLFITTIFPCRVNLINCYIHCVNPPPNCYLPDRALCSASDLVCCV